MNILKIEKKFVVENFPTDPRLFEYLANRFKCYFSGLDFWESVDIDKKSKLGQAIEFKFKYYKNIYDTIDTYWTEIKGIFEYIQLSKTITQPGELFILILKNDAMLWQQNLKLDKALNRNLFEAWYEYQKCRMSKKYSKKLDSLIKRIKKRAPNGGCENTLILDLICGVMMEEDRAKFECWQDNYADVTVRQLRTLEYSRYTS